MPTATEHGAAPGVTRPTPWRERLGAPIDGASLAALRIAFGVVMTIAVLRFAAMGWIDELYVAPRFHFHYWGFEWVRPLPAPWIHVHFAALGVAAAMVAVGLYYRVAIVLFVVLFGWVELLDAAAYLNHYYAITLVGALLAFMPAERVASLDAWRARRAARPLPSTVPSWCLFALRFQIGVVYFFAGVAKLNADWLLHAEPLRTWLLARSDMPILGPLFELEAVAFAMSWGGLAFDLCVPFLLLHARTQPLAYAAVVVFHLLTAALFQIGMFPWVMIALTPIFFRPAWPRRFFRAVPTTNEPPTRSPIATPLALGLAMWALVQVALPLRHHAYAGDVLWTQEGMRWAWHVMVAERGSVLEITAVDDEGHRYSVDTSEYLTPLQATMAASEPALLLQLAHWVRDHHAAVGRRVEVHAEAWVALNGHRSGPLVDPSVDLARETDDLGGFDWVTPLPPAR